MNDITPVNVHVHALDEFDFVTIATSRGPRLTKRWYRDGTGALQSEAADRAKTFDFNTVRIGSLDDLQQVIAGLGPTQCLILGRVKDGVDPCGCLRRSKDRAGELDDRGYRAPLAARRR